MQRDYSADTAAPRLAPLLDEALGRLGDSDRDALLLRFTQERSLREVGGELGISEEAAKKRVARALERLRGFFAARGIGVSVGILGTILSQELSAAAPAGLAATIAGGSLATLSAASGELPLLARETLNAWTWAKAKLAGAVGLGVTVLGLMLAVWPSDSDRPQPGAEDGTTATAVTGRAAAGRAQVEPRTGSSPAENARVLRVLVAARDTGVPIRHARLAVNQVVGDRWEQNYDLFTDDSGWGEVPYPADVIRLDVGVIAPGWAVRSIRWQVLLDDLIPETCVLRLDKVNDSMGGWVRDPGGRPVAGATLWAEVGRPGDASVRESPREQPGFVAELPMAQTDRDGFWQAAVVPNQESSWLQLRVMHPDFAKAYLVSSNPDAETKSALERLWARQWVTTLSPGLTLAGQVLDDRGQPVGGARVTHEPFGFNPTEAQTDSQGRFEFPGLERDAFAFVVAAEGFAPEYRKVEVRAGLDPLEVNLKPGATLRVRLVDGDGWPVPEANLHLEQWGDQRQELKWTGVSGPDGRIQWTSAPLEDELEFCAKKEGWCYTRNLKLVADEQEHVVTMRRALEISGRVSDAVSGRPIAEVRAFPGYGDGPHSWERLATRRSREGAYRVLLEEDRMPWRLRLEADGYAPFTSEPIPSDHPAILDVALQPLDYRVAVHGVVYGPDGSPAAGARVALLTPDHPVRLSSTWLEARDADTEMVTTDASGGFEFPPEPKAQTIIAVSAEGFARQAIPDAGQAAGLRLQRWGEVEVTVEPALLDSCHRISLVDPTGEMPRGGLSLVHLTRQMAQGREGQFRLQRVPPGTYALHFDNASGQTLRCRLPFVVGSGNKTAVHVEASAVE